MGVDIAASDVIITPCSTSTGAANMWVSSVDNVDKTFTLTASAAMGATAVFGYRIKKF
jgi:hypothetical protein